MHLDNPKANRPALKRVLQDAVDNQSAIVILGDVFDAMQSAGDRRGSKTDLLARYTGRDDYLTALVEDVASFLGTVRAEYCAAASRQPRIVSEQTPRNSLGAGASV
jgi:UDP-2,3-diacylglucosamine pyrophosphatase LpxH